MHAEDNVNTVTFNVSAGCILDIFTFYCYLCYFIVITGENKYVEFFLFLAIWIFNCPILSKNTLF